jgi:hypothetical protein
MTAVHPLLPIFRTINDGPPSTQSFARAVPRLWALLPISAIGGLLGDGVQRPQSNALWASFDDTKGRWGNRERHIEGGYRLGETFQCQAAEVFECDYFLYGCGDATGD